MRFSFERLGKIIYRVTTFYPDIISEELLILDYDSFKKEFLQELESMKLYLDRKAIPIKNENSFRLLVHQYQTLIISWLDRAYYRQGEKVRYQPIVYTCILDELQQFLNYISERYEPFFSVEDRAPQILVDNLRQLQKSRIARLSKNLVAENISPELALVVLVPIKEFVQSRDSKVITFRTLNYLKKYEEYILDFKNNASSVYQDRTLLDLMFFVNYNSWRMASFIIDRLIEDLASVENTEKKINKLCFYEKELNQMRQNRLAYYPEAESLQQQVTKWIREEIIYQRNKVVIVNENSGTSTAKIEKKVEVSVSVDVLSIIVRAAKDSKLLVNSHNTEDYRYIAKYFRTRLTEHLSANSLIKKSYAAERSSKQAAVDILHSMIKEISGY